MLLGSGGQVLRTSLLPVAKYNSRYIESYLPARMVPALLVASVPLCGLKRYLLLHIFTVFSIPGFYVDISRAVQTTPISF
jgi:hypothetical protein